MRHGDLFLHRQWQKYNPHEWNKFIWEYVGNGKYAASGLEAWMQDPYWGYFDNWKNYRRLFSTWADFVKTETTPFDKDGKPLTLYYEIKYTEEKLNMNKLVIELYPKTKEAVLVDKWFGRKLDDPVFNLLLKGKETELLVEAERMEKEEKENESKTRK